jgi:uncharacterized protein YwgA
MECAAMTKYQLAKLVQWAGTLETRKRMQKVVYLLQAAGCPLDADFFLHRFGPYSQEVARLTDELVADGVLDETCSQNGLGHQYGYRLTEHGAALIAAFEGRPAGHTTQQALDEFAPLAKRLAENDLRELEVASTIAFYYQTKGNWDRARLDACNFKEINADTSFARGAQELARSVIHS